MARHGAQGRILLLLRRRLSVHLDARRVAQLEFGVRVRARRALHVTRRVRRRQHERLGDRGFVPSIWPSFTRQYGHEVPDIA